MGKTMEVEIVLPRFESKDNSEVAVDTYSKNQLFLNFNKTKA